MSKDVLSIRTAQYWFHRFKNGNFELDDLPHSGRPLQVDMDLLSLPPLKTDYFEKKHQNRVFIIERCSKVSSFRIYISF